MAYKIDPPLLPELLAPLSPAMRADETLTSLAEGFSDGFGKALRALHSSAKKVEAIEQVSKTLTDFGIPESELQYTLDPETRQLIQRTQEERASTQQLSFKLFITYIEALGAMAAKSGIDPSEISAARAGWRQSALSRLPLPEQEGWRKLSERVELSVSASGAEEPAPKAPSRRI